MAFSPYKGSFTDYAACGIRVRERKLTEDFVPGTGWRTHPGTEACVTPFGAGARVRFEEAGQFEFLETDDCFELCVNDKRRQSIKFMLWINSIDLMECDHDRVHPQPQRGSATLWIYLSDGDTPYRYALQHTFAGGGWHEIEVAFNCTNTWWTTDKKVNYSHLTRMKLMCRAFEGLELKLSNLRATEYASDYVMPAAPFKGRWLTTCDCTALDGPVLSEWYNSSFDFSEKLTGESSLAIHGHAEHEDFRICAGFNPVPVDLERDVFCISLFVEDTEACGTNWQCRLEHYAPHVAFLSFGYREINAGIEGGMKNGWNRVRIPLSEMHTSANRELVGENFRSYELSFLVIFCAGASPEREFLIRTDEIYIATREQLGM